MAWAKSYVRTSKPEPYDSVLFCGICGIEVHVTRQKQPWFDYMGAERAAAAHLSTYHRLRYWLWRRLGSRTTKRFSWLVGGLG